MIEWHEAKFSSFGSEPDSNGHSVIYVTAHGGGEEGESDHHLRRKGQITGQDVWVKLKKQALERLQRKLFALEHGAPDFYGMVATAFGVSRLEAKRKLICATYCSDKGECACEESGVRLAAEEGSERCASCPKRI